MSGRVVTLGMYGAGPGTDERFWAGLRNALKGTDLELPRAVTTEGIEALWQDPRLLLGQTCGYPFVTRLAGKVRYLATPSYAVEGFSEGYYRSAIVVRQDDEARTLSDLKGRRAAYNAQNSQSGYNVFRYEIAQLAGGEDYFATAEATGSHRASVEAIVAERADVASIDPVSLALLPDALREKLRVIGWTAAAPGLPFITGSRTSDTEFEQLRNALITYLGTAEARQDLPLAGALILPSEAYHVIHEQELFAQAQRYPVLA